MYSTTEFGKETKKIFNEEDDKLKLVFALSNETERDIWVSTTFNPLDLSVIEWKCEDNKNGMGSITCNSMFTRTVNISQLWDWFSRFREMNVSRSTLSELNKIKGLPKAKQYRGAFNLYQLGKSGKRESDNVISYSGAVLDIEAPKNSNSVGLDWFLYNPLDKLKELGCKSCIYSTLRHSPDNPRIRIVLPFAEDVTPDEWKLVSRYLGYIIAPKGWYDFASSSVSQIMCMPSRCADGEGIIKFTDGKLIDGKSIYNKLISLDELPPEISVSATEIKNSVSDIRCDDKELIIEALNTIPPESLSYIEWLNIGQALKSAGFEVTDWEAWSIKDSRYHSGDCTKRWNGLKCDRITAGTIFYHAQRFGWERPYPQIVVTSDSGKTSLSPWGLSQYFLQAHNIICHQNNKGNTVGTYLYSDGVYKIKSRENIQKELTDDVCKICGTSLIKMSVIREAHDFVIQQGTVIHDDDISGNNDIEHYINFRNGLFNLKTWSLEEHHPDLFSTIQLPLDYVGEETPTPYFDKFIYTLANGKEEYIQILLEYIGACISNVHGYRYKKALILYGPGDTGKSQYRELIVRLLGTGNTSSKDMGQLEERFGTADLYLKRLAGNPDMKFMVISEVKNFKALTGGDTIAIEFKGCDSFDYRFCGFLLFCANRRPHFGGDDGEWVYERFITIPCNNVIPKDKQDKELLDRMLAEKQGIVYKSLEAFRSTLDNYQFSEGELIKADRDDYMTENSSVKSFWVECMTHRPTHGKIEDKCTTDIVYDVYREWCVKSANNKPKSESEFRKGTADYLSAADYSELTTHQNFGTVFRDYTLKLEVKERFKPTYGKDTVN